MKLAQLAAKLDGKKTKIKEFVTEIYKKLQKAALFSGSTKIYTPYKQTGDKEESLTPETQQVQERYRLLLLSARKAWKELLDLTYKQDVCNTKAKADIILQSGEVLVKDVPVTNLMFLLKKAEEIQAMVNALPTPDTSIKWVYDENSGLLRSEEAVITQRTAKVPKVLKKFDPTDKHPGQADVYYVDSPIGEYEKLVFTGACPYDKKQQMLERITEVIDAIKNAREEANMSVEVGEDTVADKLFDYVFASMDNK